MMMHHASYPIGKLRRLCIWINPINRGHIKKKKKKKLVICLYPHGDNVVKKFYRPK